MKHSKVICTVLVGGFTMHTIQHDTVAPDQPHVPHQEIPWEALKASGEPASTNTLETFLYRSGPFFNGKAL